MIIDYCFLGNCEIYEVLEIVSFVGWIGYYIGIF